MRSERRPPPPTSPAPVGSPTRVRVASVSVDSALQGYYVCSYCLLLTYDSTMRSPKGATKYTHHYTLTTPLLTKYLPPLP